MAVGNGLGNSVTCSNPELFNVSFFTWGPSKVGMVKNEVESNKTEVKAYMAGKNANESAINPAIKVV